MDSNLKKLFDRRDKPVILDGAMGSLLQSMGAAPHPALWMSFINIVNPDLVTSAHKQYIEAGAEIITTNTFRTNPSARKSLPLIRQRSLVKDSVKLALDAKADSDIIIAGSNAPAEDCYQVQRTLSSKELRYNHHRHISELMESGADFILNETQSHLDEIKIISEYCFRNNIPYITSLFFTNKLKLLSGEHVLEAVELIADFNPILISFNCITNESMDQLIEKYSLNFRWGFYLNCGTGNYLDPEIRSIVSPEEYISDIKRYFALTPSLTGACCGSTPDHIKELVKFSNERNYIKSTSKN